MFWMGIGVTATVTGIVVMAMIAAKRPPPQDLGSVSDHWIAEHRVDPP